LRSAEAIDVTRPFRFSAPMPPLTQPIDRWLDRIRRFEDLGFSSVSVSEHFTRGWSMEPLSALTAAAVATSRLRLLTLLLSNDARHPVVLHKAAATLDVISGGRLELGIGAGWLAEDYTASGLPFDPPATRIDRLAESVAVLDGLFGPDPYSFSGTHYTIDRLDGLPKPVQRPRPPILLGGGGPRMLGLAASVADIVGVHCRLGAGTPTADAAADLSAERIAEKVRWVEAAAREAGRTPEDIELQFSMYLVHVGDRPLPHPARGSTFAPFLAADPSLLATSPAVLVGSVDACAEALHERRERYGFSYFNLGSDIEAVAPIVARLAGT
jgi:probable F420-dependent oxidoreductase